MTRKFDILDVMLLLPVIRGTGTVGMREMQCGCNGRKTNCLSMSFIPKPIYIPTND